MGQFGTECKATQINLYKAKQMCNEYFIDTNLEGPWSQSAPGRRSPVSSAAAPQSPG